jgi:Na+/phosphate symporter
MWTPLDLAGAVAGLLWGAHMAQSGIHRGLGPDLRRVVITIRDLATIQAEQ